MNILIQLKDEIDNRTRRWTLYFWYPESENTSMTGCRQLEDQLEPLLRLISHPVRRDFSKLCDHSVSWKFFLQQHPGRISSPNALSLSNIGELMSSPSTLPKEARGRPPGQLVCCLAASPSLINIVAAYMKPKLFHDVLSFERSRDAAQSE